MANEQSESGSERRVAPRLPVCWSGLVLAGPEAQSCMVRDLSPTGASLGHVGTLKRTQMVGLRLRHPRGEVTLAARVMWIDDLTHTAGVAFCGASADATTRLRDALLTAVQRLRSAGPGRGHVLIVGLDPDEAEDIAQAARACGLDSVHVTTPLDAIRRLHESTPPVAVVAAPSLRGSQGRDFLELAARERPGVARILVADVHGPDARPEPGVRMLYRPWDAVELDTTLDAAMHTP